MFLRIALPRCGVTEPCAVVRGVVT
jgi:hypothetical protein